MTEGPSATSDEAHAVQSGAKKRATAARTALDVLLILVLGLVAEAAHFSWRDGRAVINADCVQYVDAAEALLSPDKTPDFALRKPGYPFILAGVALLTGNMSWAPIAVNHLLFQALLPLAAYGLGRNLRSRLVGWVAALLVIAQLQTHIAGGRLMSEAACTCILSFGILALAGGLRGRGSLWLISLAGLLLGGGWLMRSVAAVVIVASLVCSLWVMRKQPGRAVTACLCLALPVSAAVLFECGLNLRYGDQFRTSTGSLGPMLMMRARHVQGLPMPDSEAGRQCLDLLPQRAPDDAYRAVEVDTWVARYTAVHDKGMDDWQVDALMRRTALEMIMANKVGFLRCSFDVFVRHLLRRVEGPSYASVPPENRLPPLIHPASLDDPNADKHWYAYWGLPHRTLQESLELATRVQADASTRAPFTQDRPWSTLRYWSRRPLTADGLGVLRGVAVIWPGFALILCGALGLNLRTCAFLAIAYVFEGVLISICMPSELAHERYQCIWLVTDTALTAALMTTLVTIAATRVKAEQAARELAAKVRAAEVNTIRERLATPPGHTR